MKKMAQFVCVVLVTACLALGLVGCGGGDSPKGLAKQVNDLIKNEGVAAMTGEKGMQISKKIAALTAEERKIYEEELIRLMQQGN